MHSVFDGHETRLNAADRAVLSAAVAVGATRYWYCEGGRTLLKTVFAADRTSDGELTPLYSEIPQSDWTSNQRPSGLEPPPDMERLINEKRMIAIPVHADASEDSRIQGYVLLYRKKDSQFSKSGPFTPKEESLARFIIDKNAQYIINPDSPPAKPEEQYSYARGLRDHVIGILKDHSKTHSMHTYRMGAELAVALAQEMSNDDRIPLKMDEAGLKWFSVIADLHDAGKIQISKEEVLEKVGAFDGDRRNRMKAHAFDVYELLNVKLLEGSPAAMLASYHHMQPNGIGYPYSIRAGIVGGRWDVEEDMFSPIKPKSLHDGGDDDGTIRRLHNLASRSKTHKAATAGEHFTEGSFEFQVNDLCKFIAAPEQRQEACEAIHKAIIHIKKKKNEPADSETLVSSLINLEGYESLTPQALAVAKERLKDEERLTPEALAAAVAKLTDDERFTPETLGTARDKLIALIPSLFPKEADPRRSFQLFLEAVRDNVDEKHPLKTYRSFDEQVRMNIPLEASILKLCDDFEGRTGQRVYHEDYKSKKYNAADYLDMMLQSALNEEVHPWLFRYFANSKTLENYIMNNAYTEGWSGDTIGHIDTKPSAEESRKGHHWKAIAAKADMDKTLKVLPEKYKNTTSVMLFKKADKGPGTELWGARVREHETVNGLSA